MKTFLIPFILFYSPSTVFSNPYTAFFFPVTKLFSFVNELAVGIGLNYGEAPDGADGSDTDATCDVETA